MRVNNPLVAQYSQSLLVPVRKGEAKLHDGPSQQKVPVPRVVEKVDNKPLVTSSMREQAAKSYSQVQPQNSENSYRSQKALSEYTETARHEERSQIAEMLGIDLYV